MRWKSKAEWPAELDLPSIGIPGSITEDTHDTKEQAEGVCKLLQKDGFGGERCHFPVRVWTEPVEKLAQP